MPLRLQSIVIIPSRVFPPDEEDMPSTESQVRKPQVSLSPVASFDESSDDEDDEEIMLISLKEDVESNTITFHEETYKAIFARLRVAVSCLDDDGLTFRRKKRTLSAAHAFCHAVVTSVQRVPALLTKHAHSFLDFLIQTAIECEGEACSDLLSPWFSLLSVFIPGSAKRALDTAIMLLSEMVVGERSDSGLEQILLHLDQFLELCSHDVINIQYFTQLITRLLIPLYRLQCFYLSPKYKTRQNRIDRRPILLRSRLHKLFAFCLMKFPETSDVIIAGLFRLWHCCRHLRVNPVAEEVEFVKAELQNTNSVSQYHQNKIIDIKMKLTSSHQRGILIQKRRNKKQRKRIHSLKQHLLLQLRSLSETKSSSL